MKVLAMSGSLRVASINTALCRVAARLAPASLNVTVYSGLGLLPLFNPDLEPCPPRAVHEFREAISRTSALLIASPEYAHGISGVMKNALDWLVSHEGTVNKPIAVINTSPRAHHADEAIREVLRTMSTRLISDASVALTLLGTCTTEEAMLASAEVCQAVQSALAVLVADLEGKGSLGPTFPLA